MLKKIMARFGVGGAGVNLVLDKQQYQIGEIIRGKVIVEGGSVDQEINSLDIDIMLKFNVKGKEFSKVIQTVNVCRNIYAKAKSTVQFPFEHFLLPDYPVSKGSVMYYLVTRLDIARAADAGDTDNLIVLPGVEVALVIEALDILGFKEKIGSGRIEKYGQVFTYYPTTVFSDRIKEIAVRFFTENKDIKLFLEIKYDTGTLVHHAELTVHWEKLKENQAGMIADAIKDFLERESDQVALNGPKPAPDYASYQQHASGRPGFGGFAGGMVAGLLGAMMIGSLFDGFGEDMSGGDEIGEVGQDSGFDMDFGDDF
jgi:sporulation-control protein